MTSQIRAVSINTYSIYIVTRERNKIAEQKYNNKVELIRSI